MGSSSPPQPTDPGLVASQQAAFNKEAGRSSQSGSMVGQNNPYGSLAYQQTGTDQFGNPIYQSNLNLNPSQQRLFDLLTGTQQQTGQQGQSLIQRANYGAESPTQAIGDQSSGILGQQMSQWLKSQQPWMDDQTNQQDAKLRNQGIFPTPTATDDPKTWGAYEKSMGQLRQNQQMGVAGAASQFQPQAFQEASSLYALPAQMGLSLSQFGQPTSPGSALVQTPGLSIGAPNFEGDVTQFEKDQMAAYQQQQQNQSALLSGLMGLGQAGLRAAFPAPLILSDRRLKENIVRIGTLPNGIATYIFNFKGNTKRHWGVMADEVQQIKPEIVRVTKSGYLGVDYNRLLNG